MKTTMCACKPGGCVADLGVPLPAFCRGAGFCAPPKTLTQDELLTVAAEAMRNELPKGPPWSDCVKPSNPKDIVGIRKAPMSTVSAAVMAEVGVAMLEGAAKYGRHNYRAVGVRSSVYYDGTLRHLFAWWEGEDLDPDSGLSHVTKAITSLVVFRDAMLQGKVEDDRPPRAAPFYERLNAEAAATVDRHADKHPKHYTIKDAL